MRNDFFFGMGLLMILSSCNNTSNTPTYPTPHNNLNYSNGYYDSSYYYDNDYGYYYPEYTWTGPGYYWGIWFDNEWDFNHHHHHGDWGGHHGNWNGGGHHGNWSGGGHHGGGGGHGGGGHHH